MRKPELASTGMKYLLLIFFFYTVILPMGAMVSKIQPELLNGLFSNALFQESVINSVAVSSLATMISVSLAYLLAFAMNRCQIPGKSFLNIVVTLPMLIPSISHGLGLINLFGDNGFFTQLFHIQIGIYGFQGILLGSVLYSFPVAFLMLSDAMKYADMTLYEMTEVLGIPPISRFFSVTLPLMKRPLLSALFAVFTLIFTDYGVPLAIGGRFSTLPVYLYTEVIGLLNFSSGAFIGLILLLPALVSFLFDQHMARNLVEEQAFTTNRMKIKKNQARDMIMGGVCVITALAVFAIIGSFLLLTFLNRYPYDNSLTLLHISNVLNKGLLKYLLNSIVIAVGTAFFGTVLAYTAAYMTSRTKESILNRILHFMSTASLAVPGIVLGLGYIICFKGSPFYGTVFILIVVNILHFFSSPYLLAQNALKKMNRNFEDVGRTLDIPKVSLIWQVFLPNTFDTVLEMFFYFFANAMITISAVAFLFNTKTMPLAIVINQFEGEMMFAEAAFISFMILAVNVGIKFVLEMQAGRLRGEK